jgi:hypothetical protein
VGGVADFERPLSRRYVSQAMTATAAVAELPDTEPFRRKDKVVAAVDLPGVPAGTAGKVIMVSGFEWVRYWVRWANGVERGSINRNALVRPGEPFGDELAELRANAVSAGVSAGAAADTDADAGAGGGDIEVAGVRIPGALLERSKKRREFLGA